MFSPQGTNLHRDGISLCQKAEHSIGRREPPNDHDDQRFAKALVGVGLLPSALALGWRWRWDLLNEPKAADKDVPIIVSYEMLSSVIKASHGSQPHPTRVTVLPSYNSVVLCPSRKCINFSASWFSSRSFW